MNPKCPTFPLSAAEQEHVDSKLANFGDSVGKHGSLAAVTVKLSPRVSRDTNIRLINLSRAISLKPSALQALALDTVSRIPAADFFATLADLQKRAS